MGKGDVRKVLMRAGIERERIGEICAALPDEIDVGDIGDVLWRHGISRDNLIDRLGGSP
jgi:hypothetical protein